MTGSPGAVSAPSPPDATHLAEIARIAYDFAGIVLGEDKAHLVHSRLAKRLRACGIREYGSYLALIRSVNGTAEQARMLSALTTNVTQFFREGHHFEHLRQHALPPLLAQARGGRRIRIWSAGCSSGQEPYSIAMVLSDLAPDVGRLDIRILATDIDPEMIARGRQAVYDAAAASAVPPEFAARFLVPVAGGLRVREPARDLVTFRLLNLHAPWPMHGKFDVIFCRNVVIYFDTPTQVRLWQRLESALAPGGWLYVGHSERLAPGSGARLTSAGITTYRLSPQPPDKDMQQWH